MGAGIDQPSYHLERVVRLVERAGRSAFCTGTDKVEALYSFAMARFVLWGTYCSDALEKRTPYRDEHLAGLQQQKQVGTLVTLGPTEGSTHVFGIYEAESRDQVEALVKNDIYWKQGIWTTVEIYAWIQAF